MYRRRSFPLSPYALTHAHAYVLIWVDFEFALVVIFFRETEARLSHDSLPHRTTSARTAAAAAVKCTLNWYHRTLCVLQSTRVSSFPTLSSFELSLSSAAIWHSTDTGRNSVQPEKDLRLACPEHAHGERLVFLSPTRCSHATWHTFRSHTCFTFASQFTASTPRSWHGS